jgi:hypothetical protein
MQQPSVSCLALAGICFSWEQKKQIPIRFNLNLRR